MHDKRYIGIVEHQGTEYDNIFPPIITKELWNQVDAINQENKIAPSRKKEILTTYFRKNSYAATVSTVWAEKAERAGTEVPITITSAFPSGAADAPANAREYKTSN